MSHFLAPGTTHLCYQPTCHPLPATLNLQVATAAVLNAEFKNEFLMSFHLIHSKTKSCFNKLEWNPELRPLNDTATVGKNIARKSKSLGKQ